MVTSKRGGLASEPVLGRRNFLRGRWRPAPRRVRPPWGLAEADFTDRCTRCPACRAACPQDIIVAGDGGFPEVDFQRGECTFCGACREACNAGAFSARSAPPWRLEVRIGADCLALREVVCRSCAEQCERDAIVFRRNGARVALPGLDEQRCTACGACVGSCPSRAISVQPCVVVYGQ